MTICNRCQGTSFINLHQIPDNEMDAICDDLIDKVPSDVYKATGVRLPENMMSGE